MCETSDDLSGPLVLFAVMSIFLTVLLIGMGYQGLKKDQKIACLEAKLTATVEACGPAWLDEPVKFDSKGIQVYPKPNSKGG